MAKKNIILVALIIAGVLILSVVLAYKKNLIPTGGYIYILKPLPTRVPIVSGCTDVMPVGGGQCVSENGACVIKGGSFQTE
ncbi:MAG: hypothetical protein NTX26_03695 [Candidatus Parcubacteria bacterium]|nr:hypothetical protein [Candidatus Parcubacteria bacterium]